MDKTLPEILDELLRRAASTVAGRETLLRYDHTINFEVLDGTPFHVEIAGGKVDVSDSEADPGPISGEIYPGSATLCEPNHLRLEVEQATRKTPKAT